MYLQLILFRKMIKWKTVSCVLFVLTCALSSISLLPGYAAYRYPYFERYLDVFFFLFLPLTTRRDFINPPTVSYALVMVMVYLVASSLFAASNFGSLYVLVEYRQYLIILVALLFFRAFKRRLDADIIAATVPIYLLFLFLNSLLGSVYQEQYRPGVFGEVNYDIAYLSAAVLSKYALNGTGFNPVPLLAIFTVVSQSRTAVLLVFFSAIAKKVSIRSLFFIVVSSLIAFVVFMERLWDKSDSEFEGVFEQLDRLQMLNSYVSTVKDNALMALVGQSVSGYRYTGESMDYYRETQLVSQVLGINTPSNYHGHLLRGFALLGVIPYLFILASIMRQSAVRCQRQQTLFVAIVIVSTGISQSIFSHPFTGGLFASACLFGFSNSSLKNHQVDCKKPSLWSRFI